MWDAPSRFDHNNNACHNKTTSLALCCCPCLGPEKKNMFVGGEERAQDPKRERENKPRNPSSWLMITDTKRIHTDTDSDTNTATATDTAHNGGFEGLFGEIHFRIDATTWIRITICKQIQRLQRARRKNKASARNGNGMHGAQWGHYEKIWVIVAIKYF